jgi:ubiquinone/menaquinone biosynthesis C-methylase UbiE
MAEEIDWDQEADNWVRWARTPGHDAYWQYRDAFFDQIVPHPGRCTLEVGCGEGRVARDLRQRGHRVVAVDRSRRLVDYAREADADGAYLLANAAQLPVADASCDLVVAYNSLMDVADMPRTIGEATRVLESGGRLCACITHPLSNAGGFASSERESTFEITGSYFGRRKFEGTFERDGLTMTFRGWNNALEEYMRAFEAAGLVVERLREPLPVATTGQYANWHRIPMFLTVRLVKP